MFLPPYCPQNSVRAAPTCPTPFEPVRHLLQLTQVLLSQVTCDFAHIQTDGQESETPSSSQNNSRKVKLGIASPDDQIALLHTALLILKLISLLSAVKSESSSTSKAVAVLWDSLEITTNTIVESQNQQDISTPTHRQLSKSEALSDTASALTRLVMTELRRCQLKAGMSRHTMLCCGLLEALLALPLVKQSRCSAVTIATAIKDPGTLLCLGWYSLAFLCSTSCVGRCCSVVLICTDCWDTLYVVSFCCSLAAMPAMEVISVTCLCICCHNMCMLDVIRCKPLCKTAAVYTCLPSNQLL